jgi:hypothetical protein
MVTLYRGPEAEKVMIAGMLTVYEYSELLSDMTATLLGYMAWRESTDYNNQIATLPITIQLNYEILYYIAGFVRDLDSKLKCLHHILALSYIYFGWQFKTAVSTSLFFGSISTCFLTVMLKHPNKVTKISFAASFVVMRIIIGAWSMKKTLELPGSGAVIPITGSLYVMQWWWLRKIILKASQTLYPNGSGTTKGSENITM